MTEEKNEAAGLEPEWDEFDLDEPLVGDELADPALILRCYPGEGVWEHYRDNGRDYAYQDGAYTLYRFTQDAAGLHQELVRNGYRTYPEIHVERVGE